MTPTPTPPTAAPVSAPTPASIPAAPATLTPTEWRGPTCPAAAAEWFSDAFGEVTRQDLGCHYDSLVAAWIRVEAACKYAQGPTKLPSTHRPRQVGNWISHTRGKRAMGAHLTDVSNPTEYAGEWQRWWDSLQPAWRDRGGKGWSTANGYGRKGNEWDKLEQWGTNGVLSVVVALYFWGKAVHGREEFETVWEESVMDAVWMLEGLVIFYEKFKKRR
ncbi:hypothetical protein B0H16DRAFT_1334874 [Mycena metata]|uniref:Uncharacterized protein n=1 Tax=Mycena metata TaxID=1033252 RepID=A0AAD7MKU6_9AGAR|nr:hypothetical protein B0H16DRAFT_1334874 [Mycena metata]